MGDVLSVCVVGAGLASASGELVERHASSEIRYILFLKNRCIGRIKSRTHVRRKHAAVRERPSEREFAVASAEIHDLSDSVFKEP